MKQICKLCNSSIDGEHDIQLCEKAELLNSRKEIVKLKQEISDWKEAWFHLRDIIGWLWWHHPSINDDKKRTLYQTKH